MDNVQQESTATQNAAINTGASFYKDNVSAYMKKQFNSDIQTFALSSNIVTGFPNLDKIIDRLYPGFYVLGAVSSIGKTSFLLQIADQMANNAEHVIYFTLEQSKLELVSKSLSRLTANKCRTNPKYAKTAIQIRKGDITQVVVDAYHDYLNDADYFTIVQGNFSTDLVTIEKTVEDYVKATGITPIVIVDYLQIVQEQQIHSDKEKVDYITRGLKILQQKYNTVVIAISSINRSNYLNPIDFESFKESGSIEYSADVIWGMQFQILNEPTFLQAKNVVQRRKMITMAKAATPRKIELTCLKNRYGIASYSCGFLYYPQFDLFTPDINYKTLPVGSSLPNIII